MPDEEDQNLLQRYRCERSEAAFRNLVSRHLGAVHATALRCTGGRAALAEEIAQAVFVELARKAAVLPAATLPGGWLHRCARFKAIEALRAERRRRRYETEAAAFLLESDGEDRTTWLDLTPVLDEALDSLPEQSRLPLILRFYERRSLREVGSALGISDDAAQKRIQRALDALRGSLAKRGISSSASSLAPALFQTLAPQTAPGLAASISTAAWQAGAAGSLFSSGSMLPLYLAMNVKTITLAAVAIAAVAIPLAYQQRTISAQAGRIAELEQRNGLRGGESGGPQVIAPRMGRVSGREEKSGVQAMAQALDEPDPLVRMQRFSHLLISLRADDAGELAALLEEKKKSGAVLEEEEQLFLRAWGGIDGPAALRYLATKGRDQSEDGAAVMSSWASRDLAGALDWLQGQPGGGPDMLAVGITHAWSMQDLDAASKWVEARPMTDMRSGMEGVLFDRYVETRGLDGAKRWYEQMPQGNFRQRASDLIAVHLSKENPAEAMDWLSQHGETQGPGHAMVTDVVMGNLARADLPAAEAWLERNREAPEYDDAVEAVVQHLRENDPAAALKWAATIRDAARREVAMRNDGATSSSLPRFQE